MASIGQQPHQPLQKSTCGQLTQLRIFRSNPGNSFPRPNSNSKVLGTRHDGILRGPGCLSGGGPGLVAD
eukprot:218742-Rhodomonas_salina.1